jgi:hypothetical protein
MDASEICWENRISLISILDLHLAAYSFPMTFNVVYQNLNAQKSTSQQTKMSSCIQSAADSVMALLEAEKAPLVRELENQKRYIFELELQNAALRLRFEGEQQPMNSSVSERELCSAVTDTGLEELKLLPNPEPLCDVEHGEDTMDDWDLAAQLLAAKDQIARMKEHVQEHVGALTLALAAEREAHSKEKQAIRDNFSRELDACRRDLQVARQEGDASTRTIQRMTNTVARLTAGLEYNGVTYRQDAAGQVGIAYGAEVQRVMVEVVAEAKRRGLVPEGPEWVGLDAGNVTLTGFATLVENVLQRARMNEHRIAHALKEARSNGWTVAQFLQDGNVFRKSPQTGAPIGQAL